MISDSEHQEMSQIESAARGKIYGILGDWPHLKSALRRRGIFLPDSAQSSEVQRVCAAVLEDEAGDNSP